jgi:membrane dipeptidase
MLIVDAHEDLAYNMLNFGRDYSLPAEETRRREMGAQVPERRGEALLGWPDYQRGRVAVVFGTLFAAPARRCHDELDKLCYRDAEEAHRLYRSQIDQYHRLVEEHPDKFRLITGKDDLEQVLSAWRAFEDQPVEPSERENHQADFEGDASAHPDGRRVGLVVLMEGAEGVRQPAELEQWWQWGLRLIGLAWAGTRFCGGTREPGPLTREGRELLEAMAAFGFTLDISHMDEAAALQALDSYEGRIIASHCNAQALLEGYDGNRHLSDRVIRGLLERQGIIGTVPFNAFLRADWKRGDSREDIGLALVVDQIDYICQMAGDARHVGLGSDFDGGFGLQSTPYEIDTVADLQKLAPMLQDKGYRQDDVAGILGQNWIGLLEDTLPEN